MKIKHKSFNVDNTPFQSEYEGRMNPINVRLEKEARDILKDHFGKIYDKEAMSRGIRKICHDYLETLCLQRKSFNHLEAIMLIPKTIDLEELNEHSQIIAFINTKYDFDNVFNDARRFEGEYNLVYDLKDFNEVNFHYEMEMLKNVKSSCILETSKDDLKSFQAFKSKQGELYPRLDLDDCYFVRFPLNNYMDKEQFGESHHFQYWKNNHLGAYVFHDINNNIELLTFINWYYLTEIQKEVRIDYQFASEVDFVEYVMNADDENIIDALNDVLNDGVRQMKLRKMRMEYERRLSILDSLIEDE